ncbi:MULTISPECIES: proline dehydrogenase family protein [Bacillus]|uniref:proline dehydrogenase n=2 Tax=Bacillus cereus group TaxID=86661 RepID=A0A2A7D118_BACAN|nr:MULTISPECIES: proline dehydrogenase family protein [Bacillus]MCP1161748.1 proline dehydrogenase family protein [Bacillus sp. 1813sda1]MDC7976778.1 proline dehydrogenase family protein [Bacillus sp. BLCC-B18]OTW74241.1 proline dehydrogenase [Bacillus thuringiensis serovar coreanensis]OTX54252.1 proline dehydrogenase [Bacillus thuringiensis serovar sooncheon]OTX60461.1 proline dehydrogenase [Bacillus thuringiensis serovar guiyangiensis]
MTKSELQVAQAFKSIARNEHIKSYVQQSTELYALLLQAAKRFVTGETRQEGIVIANKLITKGYHTSLEYIGENTLDIKECYKVKNEFLNLIEDVGALPVKQTVSLDLSHIGLSIDPEISYLHLMELAEKAKVHGTTLMISMEESSKATDILSIYKKTTEQYSNVGITIQAHLYRSNNDIQGLLHYPGKIRVVKGAYQEASDIAMPRSTDLNQQYLQIVEQLVENNHPVSIATHDEILIKEMERRQYFSQSNVEIEMLYGIRSDMLSDLKNKGRNARVYLTYGKEWYLYLCHRIAEHPENLYHTVIDMIHSPSAQRSSGY